MHFSLYYSNYLINNKNLIYDGFTSMVPSEPYLNPSLKLISVENITEWDSLLFPKITLCWTCLPGILLLTLVSDAIADFHNFVYFAEYCIAT